MNSSTYVIAEIGKACNGNMGYCEQILHECKTAGADAIRFHHFHLESSVFKEALQKSTERAWSFQLKLPFLNEVLFTENEYRAILNRCKELGLDFIGTPWDIPSYHIFRNAGVKNIKINSLNAFNVPLIKEVRRDSRKLYISTGGLAERDIRNLYEIHNLGEDDVTLMHAVIAYPAPKTIINMRALKVLKKYSTRIGYSSNELLSTPLLAACALGATVIEKHVHLNHSPYDVHKASITTIQLKEMIREIREMEQILGREIKQESRGEMVNQDILSKSLILKEHVQKGEVISEKNLALQLPSKGVNAKQWLEVVGGKAKRDLNKGEYLFSTDIVKEKDYQSIGIQPNRQDNEETASYIPGKRGVVVRLKDIDEMIAGQKVDYVEVHYAASDLDKVDSCKDYDLDLVVHLPEYSDGVLLDLCSHDEQLRKYSIEVINHVMEKARRLKPHFKRLSGDLKFVTHPGSLTYPHPDENPSEQYALFLDSLKQLDSSGLEVLVENMTPFAWFLDKDWAPKQGMSNSFMDAEELSIFLNTHKYNMCFDVCHAKLYCNYAGKDLYTFMRTIRPYVKHFHFSDCTGIDGEGLQVGEGEINWQEVCEVFSDYSYGWTPEIWNGHHDHGKKFYEAHEKLNDEFRKYRERLIHNQ
ncbi:hypothetical protein CEN49_25280 [Fischerella thermalis CCMEE 5273]|nr:hypothetical protein CEN49_25280 [Fischerella thermalis CCMEE 5273]